MHGFIEFRNKVALPNAVHSEWGTPQWREQAIARAKQVVEGWQARMETIQLIEDAVANQLPRDTAVGWSYLIKDLKPWMVKHVFE